VRGDGSKEFARRTFLAGLGDLLFRPPAAAQERDTVDVKDAKVLLERLS
jgi:hypothetical protein